MKKKSALTSTVIVNWSLYGLIVLLVAGIGAGSYLMHMKLVGYVTNVDHTKIDTELSEQGIENAKKLRRTLDDNRESVARAAAIVADTKYYEYQDQIVQDISSYAAASGLTVLGFDFTTSTSAKATAITGVKAVVATISLSSPVNYDNYLQFLKLIERNLTKMQITQLDISNDLKNIGSVNSPVITLEVYVR